MPWEAHFTYAEASCSATQAIDHPVLLGMDIGGAIALSREPMIARLLEKRKKVASSLFGPLSKIRIQGASD